MTAVDSSTIDLHNVTFRDCSSRHMAGAVSVGVNTSMRIDASRFFNCHALWGAALHLAPNSTLHLTSSEFSEGHAEQSGGAVFAQEGSQVYIYIYVYVYTYTYVYICVYNMYIYTYIPHEKTLGIQRVSNPATEDQQISTLTHSNG